MNTLDVLVQVLTKIRDSDRNQAFESTLALLDEGVSAGQQRLRILSLLQDAIDLFSKISDLPSEKLGGAIRAFISLQEQFVSAAGSKTTAEFSNAFGLKHAILTISAHSMLIDVARVESSQSIDREELIASASRLRKELTQTNLPDYAKEALSLKLISFTKIVEECSHYTDDQIRRRVKIIFADYSSEMRILDSKYSEANEKILAWARKAATGGSEALQLTASVVGLITTDI